VRTASSFEPVVSLLVLVVARFFFVAMALLPG
jgi:hypothetical protein